ncbi:phage N-6-adenine-methyltransferase [Escherichia coli]|uniref:phage N-6-adenine-methyltransferase n=1 Tax=Escherichia coli TaxID=562 RepID=UPI001F05A529|nr:phage N-6-adenine-methyltransferase [Escherichia coli]MCH0685609.1 phage N-6-adenine-methyltransferase [Escherichia coli]MDZ8667109.1 phage N-6-adenine-methyltransferase [Escherichia coli]WRX87691.1 phage N-6-adenine-methyltransferase [Escherichia coli]
MTDKSNTPKEQKDLWRTPPEIFRALNAEFCFVMDAAASEDNRLCFCHITESQDTLQTSWKGVIPDIPGYVWLNPPYSHPMPFVQKAALENTDNWIGCVMLLNADCSVGWFKEAIKTAHEVRFITGGRLSFLSAETGKPVNGNNKGQMLVIWHPYPRTGECRLTTIDKAKLMEFGR